MMFTYWCPVKEQEEQFEIEYKICPGESGNTSGHPDSWRESFGPEIEEMKVFNKYGVDLYPFLSIARVRVIQEAIWKQLEQEASDYRKYGDI